MNHVDLFTGILGFSLAAEAVWGDEYNLVATCERDSWCQKLIRKRRPDALIIYDIHHFSKGVLNGATIDLLTGGFPCQPFSCAGKQRGTADDRHLWPEMLRVISEVRPRWVIAENVRNLLSIDKGLVHDAVLSGLEAEGYETATFVLPACSVNAPHRRDRIWIVAYCDSRGWRKHWTADAQRQSFCANEWKEGTFRDRPICEDVSDPHNQRCQEQRFGIADEAEDTSAELCGETMAYTSKPQRNRWGDRACWGKRKPEKALRDDRGGRWQENGMPKTRSRLGRTPNGLSETLDEPWGESWELGTPRTHDGRHDRVNRLRGLGNAIVPQVVIPIMQAIKEAG